MSSASAQASLSIAFEYRAVQAADHGDPGSAARVYSGKGAERSAAPLVLAARDGSRDAWNELVDRFAPTVWAVARGHRLSAADAADVSQTTWMRLVENLGRIEQPERVGAWLATTARRESLRVLRLGGRQVPNGEDMDVVPDPRSFDSPEHNVAVNQRADVISQLVENLPLRPRLLLRLLSADPPLSYKEISESLEMPIGSIGPTRARALEQLKRLALQSGLDPEDVFG
jgi:RNA polymerase sigma factor (sigma-70 family)